MRSPSQHSSALTGAWSTQGGVTVCCEAKVAISRDCLIKLKLLVIVTQQPFLEPHTSQCVANVNDLFCGNASYHKFRPIGCCLHSTLLSWKPINWCLVDQMQNTSSRLSKHEWILHPIWQSLWDQPPSMRVGGLKHNPRTWTWNLHHLAVLLYYWAKL